MDGDTELGFGVQRDSSAAKLAPNVGLEASKIPVGGAVGPIGPGIEPTSISWSDEKSSPSHCKGIFLDLENFWKISGAGPFWPVPRRNLWP